MTSRYTPEVEYSDFDAESQYIAKDGRAMNESEILSDLRAMETQLATARALIAALVVLNSDGEPMHLTPEQKARWQEYQKMTE